MKNLFTGLMLLILLWSCDSGDSVPQALGSYDDGILILNEGNMQTGTITYSSFNLATVQQDIFSIVNPEESVGGYAQSIFFADDRAFIISGFANKITVVNRYTFEYIATISDGLNNPRYGAVAGGKAYVTNSAGWESGADDYVAVIDLAGFTVNPPIDLNTYTERIYAANNKIVVSNGYYGGGTSFTLIDPVSSEIEMVDVQASPNSLAITNEFIYALATNASGAHQIVKTSVQNSAQQMVIDINVDSSPANLTFNSGKLYFTSGSKVYVMDPDSTFGPAAPLIETASDSPYIGYGFAVHDGRIYIAEAQEDFVSDGKVLVYSTEGAFIGAIPAGIGPNSIYFN